MVILDLKGKLLKKVMISVAEMNPEFFYPYSTYEGKVYQLVENFDNEKEEIWELNVTDIEIE